MMHAASERYPQKQAWTLKEVSASYGLSEVYLRKLIDRGLLKVVRFGRAVRVLDADLKEFAQKGVQSK